MREDQKEYIYRTGIGQDSHKFALQKNDKKCILAGVVFEEEPNFLADSDGDVIFHAICNAITSLTGVPILGKIAIDLCKNQKTIDSAVYLQEAVKTLKNQEIIHVAITIEGKKPRLQSKIDEMRKNIAKILHVEIDQIGMTATSGDGLTSFGKGEGVMCFCLITTRSMVIKG